jgi:rhamnosyltransferase
VTRPFASVLIPTRNPGPGIERVLQATFDQRPGFPFEVVIVDSGSTQTDLAAMQRFPVHVHQIAPAEFGHGRTRDLLASLARGRVLMYLSQDAEPASPDWMATLVAVLADPKVAGAYARQIPRPDADPLIRFFLAKTYGSGPVRRRMQHDGPPRINDIFFSNVSSALRRDVWERVPFRDVIMSEDQYWAYDALSAGYEVAYEPAARVYHSHNYSLRTLFRRNWQSAASLRGLIADSPSAIARRGLGYILEEALFLVREGRARWLPYMLVYEATKSLGFAMGSTAVATAGYRPAATATRGGIA